jgi:toxin ParE1/3/4
MDRSVEISPAGRHDLANIWAYISQDNEDAATRTIQSFYRTCLELARMPSMGRDRSRDLHNELYSYPVGKYVVYYRFDDAKLELIRVIHSARDVTSMEDL